jgi:hypothetical protein
MEFIGLLTGYFTIMNYSEFITNDLITINTVSILTQLLVIASIEYYFSLIQS